MDDKQKSDLTIAALLEAMKQIQILKDEHDSLWLKFAADNKINLTRGDILIVPEKLFSPDGLLAFPFPPWVKTSPLITDDAYIIKGCNLPIKFPTVLCW